MNVGDIVKVKQLDKNTKYKITLCDSMKELSGKVCKINIISGSRATRGHSLTEIGTTKNNGFYYTDDMFDLYSANTTNNLANSITPDMLNKLYYIYIILSNYPSFIMELKRYGYTANLINILLSNTKEVIDNSPNISLNKSMVLNNLNTLYNALLKEQDNFNDYTINSYAYKRINITMLYSNAKDYKDIYNSITNR